MNKQELQDLLSKLADQDVSADQKRALYQVYNDYLKSNSLEGYDESIAESKMKEFDLQQVFEQKKTPVYKIWRWAASVAAVGLVIGFSYWAFQRSSDVMSLDDQQLVHQESNVPKITNKAIAILPNGEEIVLNSSGLNAIDEADAARLAGGKNQFITLKTPRGSQLNFALPDGSRVWLNAETSLTYPATFGKDSRKVQLDGEAYFEIVKQERSHKRVSFIVDAGKQEIKVLGTKFNVNNYSDEAASTTTLVEGAVEVNADNQVSLLAPNQQFVQFDGRNKIVKVNALDYIDWKEGIINLNKQDFPAIAKLIERNFDVEFVGEDFPDGFELDGELASNVNIDELLKGLGATMRTKFVREGRYIRLEKK